MVILYASHILKFDLDWLHFGFATTALNRENVAQAIGTKMAASVRGFDITIYPLKHPGCFQLLWKRIDKLHYLSDDLLRLAIRHGFDEKTPHEKITPAICIDLFEGQPRMELRFPLSILSVARLEWKKGFDYMLQALSILAEKEVRFKYVVIGEGTDKERLKFAAYQLGINEHVKFVGKKSPDEVRDALKNSDIYLQYSVQEGFCNAVIEAQAMGLVCIVSDAGGLPENVLHRKTGRVVASRKPDLLASEIERLANDSDSERVELTSAAILHARRVYNLDKQRIGFLRFYGEAS